MRKGTQHLASKGISVVDDMSDSPIARRTSEAIDEEGELVEVLHLEDECIEVNGYVFHENWDEIDPPGGDDGPDIPHELVMAETRAMLRKPVERC